MKQILIPLLIFISLHLFSQTKEKKIKEIRKQYEIIEGSISKKKTKKQFFEYRCPERNEHGSACFIFKDKELQKIEISSIIDDENRQMTMYYFLKGKLFFAYHQSVAPENLNGKDVIYNYTEKRVYFENEQAFQCLEKGYSENPDETVKVKSENIPNKEVDCKDIEFIKQHLKKVQQYKDIKDEISICIW